MADLGKQVGKEEEEEERLLEGMAVLDFDMLCSTVALQTQGKWRNLEGLEGGDEDGNGDGDGGDFGGAFRMWEGELLDCFEDRRIAIESACCPCYRFGKNMRRAGFSSCFLQGTIYFVLVLVALLNCVAFIVTKRSCFLYLSIAFTVLVGTYLGFFRSQIKKKFNIRGSENNLDDCIYHLICPCCTLCQESRTLEMNNVQDGIWHGRGDTICIGNLAEGRKAFFELQSPPLVSPMFPETCSVQIATDANGHS
ncbi:PLAC8 motif-containing protein [Parasponia andersonii]|uniref:PLAC8 motif-containing protein n=1 Tax=Parasponia andersonii TaxID=3476 RepID=A0A2P5BKJ8_PARAD|nr:PLAC8 motif-containing protein [Parasponia andersonii]